MSNRHHDRAARREWLLANGSPYAHQQRRAQAWHALRKGYQTGDPRGQEEIDALLWAKPEVRDAIVHGFHELLHEIILLPARQERYDLSLLQDMLLAEWLVLACTRLGLPVHPFDDLPEDPYHLVQTIAAAAAERLPSMLRLAPLASVSRYANAPMTAKKRAMREAVWFMVTMNESVMTPTYEEHCDPVAVERALLVAWLRLAAEHAAMSPREIASAIPSAGPALDAMADHASIALAQLCATNNLVRSPEATNDNLEGPHL